MGPNLVNVELFMTIHPKLYVGSLCLGIAEFCIIWSCSILLVSTPLSTHFPIDSFADRQWCKSGIEFMSQLKGLKDQNRTLGYTILNSCKDYKRAVIIDKSLVLRLGGGKVLSIPVILSLSTYPKP